METTEGFLRLWMFGKMTTLLKILNELDEFRDKNDAHAVIETLKGLQNKHTDTIKPFRFTLASIDFRNTESLAIVGIDVAVLLCFLEKVELSSLDHADFMAIEWVVSDVQQRVYIIQGYRLRQMQARQPYIDGPGANSSEAGQWSTEETRTILEKYGGYSGFAALPYGEKKPVMEEIEKKLKSKDMRNIFKILNKIRSMHNKEN